MLEISSIILSSMVGLISIIISIISFKRNRRDYLIYINTKANIEKGIEIYNQNLRDLIAKKNEGSLDKLDLAKNLRKLSDVINTIYPSAKFNISIKLLEPNDNSDDSFVVSYVSYYNNEISRSETTPIPVNDNTDFNSILHEGRKFFFVSDIRKYSQLAIYNNSSSDYLTRWNSSIVFPIKEYNHSSKQSIIGFLCIDSIKKLNNPRKNSLLIKTLRRITEELSLVLINP